MKRRINHTGRSTIEKSEVTIKLVDSQERPPRFTAEIDLSRLGLPDQTEIFIEAYRDNTLQRFACGTVGEFSLPDDTLLSEIDLEGEPLFRVKLIDASSGTSRLLASAVNLRAVNSGEDENRDALIRTIATDLGEVPWKVEVLLDEKPILYLNNNIPDAASHFKQPLFSSLVLPGVVREVFMNMFWNGAQDDSPSSWYTKWMEFGKDAAGEPPPPDTEDPFEAMEWIDSVVRKMSNKHKLSEKLNNAISDTGT